MKEAEYIQFSWFSNEFVNQDIEQIYLDLVGTDADTSQRNRNVSPAQPYLCQANGICDDLTYLVRINEQRLDFIVRGLDMGTLPIGTLIDVNSYLSELVEKVSAFKVCGIKDINRQALVVKLCSISKNLKKINEQFLKFCPLKTPSNTTLDLFFRFNRRKNMDKLCEINRVVSYYTGSKKGVILNDENEITNRDNYYTLNVLLDYNTVPDRNLEKEIHKDVWNGFAREIGKFAKNPSVENME